MRGRRTASEIKIEQLLRQIKGLNKDELTELYDRLKETGLGHFEPTLPPRPKTDPPEPVGVGSRIKKPPPTLSGAAAAKMEDDK